MVGCDYARQDSKPDAFDPGKHRVSGSSPQLSAAESGAESLETASDPAELRYLLAHWSLLSEEARERIIGIVAAEVRDSKAPKPLVS